MVPFDPSPLFCLDFQDCLHFHQLPEDQVIQAFLSDPWEGLGIRMFVRVHYSELTDCPGGPRGPTGPGGPIGPLFPGIPVGPGGPMGPSFPLGPGPPSVPGIPGGPGRPAKPLGPGNPLAPISPGIPGIPDGPSSPAIPGAPKNLASRFCIHSKLFQRLKNIPVEPFGPEDPL